VFQPKAFNALGYGYQPSGSIPPAGDGIRPPATASGGGRQIQRSLADTVAAATASRPAPCGSGALSTHRRRGVAPCRTPRECGNAIRQRPLWIHKHRPVRPRSSCGGHRSLQLGPRSAVDSAHAACSPARLRRQSSSSGSIGVKSRCAIHSGRLNRRM